MRPAVDDGSALGSGGAPLPHWRIEPACLLRRTLLVFFALSSPLLLVPRADAQATDAASVALALAQATIRHDNVTAATFVTNESRSDFLALTDLQDRLNRSVADLQATLEAKLKPPAAAVPLMAALPRVSAAEIAGQKQIDPRTVEITLRLTVSGAAPPLQTVTWRAVQENGAWKIVLPPCASPEVAAPLRQKVSALLDVNTKTTASIANGELHDLRTARQAFRQSQQRALAGLAGSSATPARADGSR